MKKTFKILLFSISVIVFITLFLTLRPVQIGGGNYYFIVSSGSMEPTLSTGDWIVSSKVDFKDVHVGDIIAVQHPTENFLVVHRVVDKNETCLVTKGDACDAADNFVTQPKDVLARYSGFKIPKFGFLLYFCTKTFPGLIVTYYIPCFVVILIYARKVRNWKKGEKKGGR